jgi:beta-galactosidase
MKSWNLGKVMKEHPLQVSVYTRCDEVRLELNGEAIGTKKVTKKQN